MTLNQEQTNLRQYSKIAFAALGGLLLLALLFFRERMLFADSAFLTFQGINTGGLAINGGRYGMFIADMMPAICARLHLPVSVCMMAYNASFNCFSLLVCGVLVFRLRQYSLAILMALFYFLFTSASFFLPAEASVGISWMFLFLGFTLYYGAKKSNAFFQVAAFFLFGFLALSSHFIVTIPTLFLWVYLILEKTHWPFAKNKTILLSSGLAVILLAIFLHAISGTTYDSQHLHGVTHFSIKDLIESFTKPVVTMFLYRCLVNYWIALPVLILGLRSLVKTGNTKLAIWTIIAIIGYIMLMGLSYGDYDKNVLLVHIELEWAGMGIIVATPFVFSFLPTVNARKAMLSLGLIFAVRAGYIISYYPAFHWRIVFEEQILAQMQKKGITKLVMYDGVPQRDKWLLNWAFPYESILISTMNGDSVQRTFAFVNPDEKQTFEQLKDPKAVYGPFYIIRPAEFNRAFFLIDSTSPTVIASYSDFMK